jgi:putative endonuclease
MAFTRSAVRSRLAPPAFARFASYGSASPRTINAKQAEAAAPKFCRNEGGLHMKYVYILKSIDLEHFYVGVTDDLRARLAKHNAGGAPHTSKYKPWQLKTYIAFSDERQAFNFEKYLKSASGRAFAKKRL